MSAYNNFYPSSELSSKSSSAGTMKVRNYSPVDFTPDSTPSQTQSRVTGGAQGHSSASASASWHILDIEIDRGCDPVNIVNGGTLCNGSVDNIPLYKYHEVPDFLKDNPYVVQGYRVALPFSTCFQSLFVWSNETINIWSHLLGFILFFLLMIWDNVVHLPDMGASTLDHVVLTVGLACFQFCMLCSAGYHLFRCHSERASRRWLALDLTGISVGLIGCYLPGVHYAFYCLSVWRDLYLIVVSVLFAMVLFFQTQPHLYSNSSFYKLILIYIGLVAYGIIPTVHWVLLNGGLSADIVQLFVPKVTVMYILGVLALIFYTSKIPERCCPGQCDYIGSSHQWWHLISVVAFLWWHQAGLIILEYRLHNPCLP